MHETLAMLPLVEARRRLTGRALTLDVLRPPYPALGVGALRILRVRERADSVLELTAGYDTYERLA